MDFHSVDFVLFILLTSNLIDIKQNFGSCGYRVSEVELLNNGSTDELVNNTSTANNLANGLAGESDLLLTTNRTRITDNSENPSHVAVSEIPEGRSGGSPIYKVNSQPVGFPVIEFEDDQQLINLASWEALEDKAFPSSPFSTPSSINCRQSIFPRDIFSADATFGTIFFFLLFKMQTIFFFIYLLLFPTASYVIFKFLSFSLYIESQILAISCFT